MVKFLLLFLFFYLWHGLGITIGYHRLLAHRALRCVPIFEYVFVVGGYLAFQGSPIWWAAIHRAHHRYSDTDLDPHSPKKGIRYALLGWLFDSSYLPHLNLATHCKDLIKNKFYKLLEPRGGVIHANALNLLINIAYRALLLYFFGWLVFWANITASIGVFSIPQLLNVACHLPKWGYRNFQNGDDSVNIWWVGILALGEGWHNNHHAYPGSSRSGIRMYEFDLSWQVIRLARLLGLVIDANEPERMLRIVRPRKAGATQRLRRIKATVSLKKTA
jgi:stearoyl-CoA desaturase (delta-9 desaturase)